MWSNPKTPKVKKKPKGIKRGRTKFKAFGENPFKSYHRRHTDPEIARWALAKAEERRRNPTPEEAAVCSILAGLGIKYEREYIWENGDHPVFSDFALPDYKMTLEIDGPNHKDDVVFDKKRALWLARVHKYGTVRFTNQEVRNGVTEIRLRQMFGIVSPCSLS